MIKTFKYFFLCTLIAILALFFYQNNRLPKVCIEHYSKIQRGMSLEQVEQFLGPPDSQKVKTLQTIPGKIIKKTFSIECLDYEWVMGKKSITIRSFKEMVVDYTASGLGFESPKLLSDLSLSSLRSEVGEIFLTSLQDERRLGDMVNDTICKNNKIGDPKDYEEVITIAEKIFAVSKRKELKFTITILDDDDTVNAYAAPAGYVYLTTGLLDKLNTDHQIAAVIGHEVAHVEEKHSLNSIRMATINNIGLFALKNFIFSDEDSTSDALINYALEWASDLGNLKYSRMNEHDADLCGMELAIKAGYKAQGMVELLTVLKEMGHESDSTLMKMLSTHPMSKDRIIKVKEAIHSHGTNISTKTNESLTDSQRNQTKETI